MKPLQIVMLAILLCGIFVLDSSAQTNQWTWLGGNKLADQSGRYGTKGVASSNNYPGNRANSIYFSDKNGNFWLFGGTGIDAAGNGGLLNDLWKFDGINWTWVSGSNTANQNGKRATRGTPDPGNTPGSRQYGAGGVDNNGNIWLFGGEGYFDTSQIIGPTSSGNSLNDLWKFDGSNWTWVKGGNGYSDKEPGGSFYYYGVYGTQGVAAKSNYPGVRSSCLSWMDLSGNFWIYGGDGYADSSYYPTGSTGPLSDLWKWDGNNWTWMGGNRSSRNLAVYGLKGIPATSNSPGGGRVGSAAWTDKNGNFWLFGGYTFANPSTSGFFNDLWKFDGTNWTWVSGSDTAKQFANFGSMGVTASGNIPGGRSYANGWSDTTGTVWIFGGNGLTKTPTIPPLLGGYLNDLWKFDGINWTWVSGADTVNRTGIFGTKGVAAVRNSPGSRGGAMAWSNKNGKQMIFGGSGLYNGNKNNTSLYYNDLWSWDGNKWTWLNGNDTLGVDEPGIYGTKGVASPTNRPEARSNSSCWTDVKGNKWLFGGEAYPYSPSYITSSSNFFNDLWKFDGINWTWVSGSNIKNQPANFGIKGVAASTNVPAAGSSNPTWTDLKGNQWILNSKDNLWKWDGVNWTWIYGDSANKNSTRINAAYWSDKQGNFWLMGGNGYKGAFGSNNFGDQLKWDGTKWDTVKNYIYNSIAKNGTLGVADTANFPGAREGMTIWKDSSDNIWMFGGEYGYIQNIRGPIIGGGSNNDLWKWDGKAWTWVNGSGPNNTNYGNYGTIGIPSPNNQPTKRKYAIGWVGTNGNLWLFGGYGNDLYNVGLLNDLWVWDGKYWTWMAGSNMVDQFSSYGVKGSPSTNNTPGGRQYPLSWRDNTGSFWLLGGTGRVYGKDNISIYGYGCYNDLWKFNYGYVTATSNTPTINTNHSAILLLNNPSSTNEFHFLSDQFYKKLQWQIIDENGRLLQEGGLHAILKSSVQTVPTQQLNNGIYFIRFIGDDKKIQTLKWIKL